MVRHGFDHVQYGFGDSQTNRVGGRVRDVGYARINGAQSRTHARRLRQPEWVGAAGRRISPQSGDELRNPRVGNALADFLTRDREHRPGPRLKRRGEAADQRALPDAWSAADQAGLVVGARAIDHAIRDRLQPSQLGPTADE